MVAVAHPDLFAGLKEPARQQVDPLIVGCDIGAAEFGGAMTAFHLAAQIVHHDLLAIADTKDRHAKVIDRLRRARGAFARDAVGAARKDHRLGREFRQEGIAHVLVGVDFAVDVQLAQAARD